LKDFPWEKLNRKELEPPFLPNEDEFDLKQQNANNNFEEDSPEVMKQNAILLRRNSVQGLFNGYNFDSTTAGTSSPTLPSNLQKISSTHSNFNQNNSIAIANHTTMSFSASMEQR